MKRIAMMVLRNLFVVPFLWIKLCYYMNHRDNYTDEQHNKLFKKIVYYANKGGNVRIKASGIENIPKESGFLMTPNHQGMYDILAITDVCPQPFAFVAKKEVQNVPLLKQVFICSKSFMIDRDNVRQSMQVIIDVCNELKNGRNYCIFPEGTRSRNGNEIGEFKGGSFKAATKAKAPILPIALIDAYKPFDSHTISTVEVQVHFLEPLMYEDYKDMKTSEIAEEVSRRIRVAIKDNE